MDTFRPVITPVPNRLLKLISSYKMGWENNATCYTLESKTIVSAYSKRGGWYLYFEQKQGKVSIDAIQKMLPILIPSYPREKMAIIFPLHQHSGVELWSIERPPTIEVRDASGKLLGHERRKK